MKIPSLRVLFALFWTLSVFSTVSESSKKVNDSGKVNKAE